MCEFGQRVELIIQKKLLFFCLGSSYHKICKVVFDNFFGDSDAWLWKEERHLLLKLRIFKEPSFSWWYYQVSKLLDFVNKEVEDSQDEAESLIKHEDRRKDNLEMEIVVHHNGAYEESDRGENAKIR